MTALLLLFTLSLAPTNNSVAVSIRPLEFIVKKIGGENLKVQSIVSSNISAHTYEPNPSDIKKLHTSTIAIYVSPELDLWMVKNRKKEIFAYSDWIPANFKKKLKFEHEHHGHEHHEHGHDEHHHHHELTFDPHFWMDPLTVKASLPQLCEFLCQKFPNACENFKKNQKAFENELDALHKEIKEMLKDKRGRPVMTTHDFLGYFTERYELEYLQPIEPIPGKEISPKDMARLLKLVKEKKLKTIFSEPQLNDQNVRVLAKSAGTNQLTLDPQGSVEGIESYADLIRWNAKQIESGL